MQQNNLIWDKNNLIWDKDLIKLLDNPQDKKMSELYADSFEFVPTDFWSTDNEISTIVVPLKLTRFVTIFHYSTYNIIRDFIESDETDCQIIVVWDDLLVFGNHEYDKNSRSSRPLHVRRADHEKLAMKICNYPTGSKLKFMLGSEIRKKLYENAYYQDLEDKLYDYIRNIESFSIDVDGKDGPDPYISNNKWDPTIKHYENILLKKRKEKVEAKVEESGSTQDEKDLKELGKRLEKLQEEFKSLPECFQNPEDLEENKFEVKVNHSDAKYLLSCIFYLASQDNSNVSHGFLCGLDKKEEINALIGFISQHKYFSDKLPFIWGREKNLDRSDENHVESNKKTCSIIVIPTPNNSNIDSWKKDKNYFDSRSYYIDVIRNHQNSKYFTKIGPEQLTSRDGNDLHYHAKMVGAKYQTENEYEPMKKEKILESMMLVLIPYDEEESKSPKERRKDLGNKLRQLRGLQSINVLILILENFEDNVSYTNKEIKSWVLKETGNLNMDALKIGRLIQKAVFDEAIQNLVEVGILSEQDGKFELNLQEIRFKT